MHAFLHHRQNQQSQGKLKLWLALITVGSIITVGGVTWALSSNKGTITHPDAVKRQAAEAPFKSYNSKYVRLMYKGIYTEKRLDTGQPGVEQSVLRAHISYEKTIGIEIQPTPQGSMESDSGFQYRQQHPELYKQQQIVVADENAVEWLRIDGSEQTIYIPHSDRYAVISFAIDRTNDTDGLPEEVATLLQTFSWK